ncbi:MAG: hypothetical protein ACKVKH_15685 [Verrucomicrobiales bacterium]|jgi:hypothetical protein
MKPLPFLLCLSSFLFVLLQAGARKPNFVYVMVDDAGHGDFSCFNPLSPPPLRSKGGFKALPPKAIS